MSKLSKLRIAAVLEGDEVSGPAKNLLKFARDCQDQIDLTLVTFQRVSKGDGREQRDNPLLAQARELDIPAESVEETNAFDLTTLSALRRIFERRKPQIVQTHGTKSHFLVSLLGQRRFSWIAFHHGYTAEDLKMRLYQQFDRWSLRRCDSAVTVCEDFAALLKRRGVSSRQLHVVHNAIETNLYQLESESVQNARHLWKVGPEECILLSVGRLSPEKGHAFLISAVSRMAAQSPKRKVRAIIAGRGPCEKALKEQARSLGVEWNVEFVGHRSELRTLFSIADIFVLPSLSEGSPNVLLESMAARVPIVATKVGGVPEVVKDGESALLVAPSDVDSLEAAVCELLTNRPLADRLAAAAFERVCEDFSPAKRNERLLNIYSEARRIGELSNALT